MNDIDQAKINMMRDMQCQMTCSDGSGRRTGDHTTGCPNYICSFEQMKKSFEDSNKSDTE